MSAARFHFVDAVTSDVSFVAHGDTLGEAFHAAADALLAATLENPEAVQPRLRRTLRLEGSDPELLLLRFLNELVYLRDAEGLLLRPARVAISGEGPGLQLEAEFAGEHFARGRHQPGSDVKAATAHGLQLARAGAGFEATVTLDV
jgi:SHS2 domain-containing protein